MNRTVTLPRAAVPRRWMALDEASKRLGISATTLRRWSDAGLIETFVTPGGHRRFDAASVEALLPGSPDRPTMERLGETPERISKVYRRESSRTTLPWVGALDESQRNIFREHGRVVASELLATLDAATESDRAAHLTAASETAAQYGVAAAVRNIPVSATVETFMRFRRPFLLELAAVARRRALDTTAATDLLVRASDAFDQILAATLRAYEDTAPGSGGRRAGSKDGRRDGRPASSSLPSDSPAGRSETTVRPRTAARSTSVRPGTAAR